jgi:disulfide bond formation protein DsbB
VNRAAPLAIAIACLLVVGGALAFQYLGGLRPCELCLYQRWPYYAAAALGLIAAAVGNGRATKAALLLAALLFAVDAGLAFYHAGVEQHWFPGPGACTGLALQVGSVEDLRAQLLATPPVRCDEIQWSLFGISLAGWNVVAALALAAFSLAAFARLRRAA